MTTQFYFPVRGIVIHSNRNERIFLDDEFNRQFNGRIGEVERRGSEEGESG